MDRRTFNLFRRTWTAMGALLTEFDQPPLGLLRPENAAKELCLPSDEVRRMVQRGDLLCARVGGRWHIPRAEIWRWRKQHSPPRLTAEEAAPEALLNEPATEETAARDARLRIVLRKILKEIEWKLELARPPPPVMSLRRAAYQLSVSKTTLKKMMAEGRIRFVKRGSKRWIVIEEIQRITTPMPAKRRRARAKLPPKS